MLTGCASISSGPARGAPLRLGNLVENAHRRTVWDGLHLPRARLTKPYGFRQAISRLTPWPARTRDMMRFGLRRASHRHQAIDAVLGRRVGREEIVAAMP